MAQRIRSRRTTHNPGTGTGVAGAGPAADEVAAAGAVVAEAPEAERTDLYLALLAGPVAWASPTVPVRPEQRAAASGTLIAVAAAVTVGALHVALGDVDLVVGLVALTGIAVAGGAVVAPTMAWAFGLTGDRPTVTRPGLVAVARVVLGLVMAVLALLVARRPLLVPVWPYGLLAGCDVTLTLWLLGMEVRPRRFWFGFLRSGLHLGILVAVLLALVLGTPASRPLTVLVYLSVHVVVLVAAVTAAVLERGRRLNLAAEAEQAELRRQEEHRRRAHWLHDDVCSELRLLRLQLETGRLAPDQLAGALDDLDHRLRLRQLDELIQGGAVHLADVVQPFLRTAQAHGVEILGVPRFEEGSLVLDEAAARLALRSLAVLVSNSINAGTRHLWVRARTEAGGSMLVLEVEDDAGGFEPNPLMAGRGLDSLRRALDGRLELVRTEHGTLARARILREVG